MHIQHAYRTVLAAAAFLTATLPASAHHVMGGKTPSTFFDGLLSGLGHPVIGPDHLAFLVAVGIAVGASGLNLGLPIVFVAFSAIGVALHVSGVGIPAAEIVVALSVLLVGVVIARGRALPVSAWAALFAVSGLFHGYAYGEAISGAEPAPLGAYLVGLVVVQSALSVGVALLARRVMAGAAEIGPRLAGAAVAGVGFAILIGQIIPGA